MSDFFDLVKQRESCRNYNPDKRPTKEQLVNCIEAAGLAPSACNSQPWSFIVINDPQKSPEVAHSIQASGINQFTEKCPAFIVICEEPAYLIGRPEPSRAKSEICTDGYRHCYRSPVLCRYPAGTVHLHHGRLRLGKAA